MTAAVDTSTWPRTGWCWKCGPTRRPIAPAQISELECCADHLPSARRYGSGRRTIPDVPEQLTLDVAGVA